MSRQKHEQYSKANVTKTQRRPHYWQVGTAALSLTSSLWRPNDVARLLAGTQTQVSSSADGVSFYRIMAGAQRPQVLNEVP